VVSVVRERQLVLQAWLAGMAFVYPVAIAAKFVAMTTNAPRTWFATQMNAYLAVWPAGPAVIPDRPAPDKTSLIKSGVSAVTVCARFAAVPVARPVLVSPPVIRTIY